MLCRSWVDVEAKAAIATAENTLNESRERLEVESKAAVAATIACSGYAAPPDPQPLRDQLATAESTNRMVRENYAKAEAEQQLVDATDTSDKLTAELDAVARERQERCAAADLPLEGLAFDQVAGDLLFACKTVFDRTLRGELIVFAAPLSSLVPDP